MAEKGNYYSVQRKNRRSLSTISILTANNSLNNQSNNSHSLNIYTTNNNKSLEDLLTDSNNNNTWYYAKRSDSCHNATYSINYNYNDIELFNRLNRDDLLIDNKMWLSEKPISVLQLDPADRAVLKIADQRDKIQTKTFTKWINKHLRKVDFNFRRFLF